LLLGYLLGPGCERFKRTGQIGAEGGRQLAEITTKKKAINERVIKTRSIKRPVRCQEKITGYSKPGLRNTKATPNLQDGQGDGYSEER
jgi:hypothetical protein